MYAEDESIFIKIIQWEPSKTIQLLTLFSPFQTSSINPQEIAPVIAPAPSATAAPTVSAINKRGRPKGNRTPQRTIFRWKKNKIQGETNTREACCRKRRKIKGEEGFKTRFSPRRQGHFREIDAPLNQGTPSPKLL